jgi:hypothetical protein
MAQKAGFTFSEPLVYLTVFGLFSEALRIHYEIDIKFFYLIILVGCAAAALRWDFRLNQHHLLALLYVWVTGFAAVLAGTDTVRYYLQEAVGISICSIYFYIFLCNQRRSLIEIFELYARFAYYVCWIGLLIMPVASALAFRYQPVHSIMSEPQGFASVVFPAAFFYVFNAIYRKRNRKEALVTSLAILLSGSATAFVGVVIALMLLLKNRLATLALAVLVASLFAAVTYVFDPHTRVRVDDSLSAITGMDVTGVNLSTYATVSNAYVTSRVLSEHPWFGIGIGAHRLAHDEFIGELPGSSSSDVIDLNAPDASSLLLRAGSELGLVGVCLILFFICRFYIRGNSELAVLSNGVLIYLALKLLREGHWFPPETYFFVWVYVFAWMERRREILAT